MTLCEKCGHLAEFHLSYDDEGNAKEGIPCYQVVGTKPCGCRYWFKEK